MRRYVQVSIAIVILGSMCALSTWSITPTPAHGAQAPVASKAKPLPGWPGQKAQYLGRYRLVSSNDSALARQGELTVFMRKVPPRISPVPLMSGILALYGAQAANVFYVTNFSHLGAKLLASVHLGLYTGPVIGKFNVLSLSPDHLTVSFVLQNGDKATLRFVRFSPNPHP